MKTTMAKTMMMMMMKAKANLHCESFGGNIKTSSFHSTLKTCYSTNRGGQDSGKTNSRANRRGKIENEVEIKSLKHLRSVLDHGKKLGFANGKIPVSIFYQMTEMDNVEISDYSSLMGTVTRMKLYKTTLGMIKKINILGIHHSTHTLAIWMNCLCHVNQVNHGFSLLGKSIKLGLEPTAVTYNTLLKGLCLDRRYADAFSFFNKLPVHDLYGFNIMIMGLAGSGQVKEAMDILLSMYTKNIWPDFVTFNSLLEIRCNDNYVVDLFNSMHLLDVPQDQYSVLLGTLMRRAHHHVVVFLFENMGRLSIYRDAYCMHIAISCFCHLKQVRKGFSIVGTMVKSGMTPNGITFCSLIRGFIREGRLQEAICLLKKVIAMKEIENDPYIHKLSKELMCDDVSFDNLLPTTNNLATSKTSKVDKQALNSEDFMTSPSSQVATSKLSGNRTGCTCIACSLPPSGKSCKHNHNCTCMVCLTEKRGFHTLMLKPKSIQKPSETEEETGTIRKLDDERNSSEILLDEDHTSDDETNTVRTLSSPFKGQTDLNIQPGCENELSPNTDSGSLRRQ